MSNIVLTSCGIIDEDFKSRFYEVIPKDELKNKKILYVTTAMDGESDDDRSWADKEYKTILELGVSEKNIVEYKIGKSQDNLEDFDIMYMMGGNTFYLLDVIRKTGFDRMINNFLNAKKLYIGSSAGSIIIGNSIETAAPFDDNNVGMTEFSSLKLVDGIIIPHANKKEEFIDSLKKEMDEKIIPLCDGNGIIV
jgi:dipeptidase E